MLPCIFWQTQKASQSCKLKTWYSPNNDDLSDQGNSLAFTEESATFAECFSMSTSLKHTAYMYIHKKIPLSGGGNIWTTPVNPLKIECSPYIQHSVSLNTHWNEAVSVQDIIEDWFLNICLRFRTILVDK